MIIRAVFITIQLGWIVIPLGLTHKMTTFVFTLSGMNYKYEINKI